MGPLDDAHTPTPTPPTRVMARRIDETTAMDPSDVVTLVLAQRAGGDLKAAARRAGAVPPSRFERARRMLVAALQTVAVTVWTVAEPWLDRAGRRIGPVGRTARRRAAPVLDPAIARSLAVWHSRFSPAVERTVETARRWSARVWAGLAPARARATELRPTDQTFDLLAATLLAGACGLAAVAIGIWLAGRLGTPLGTLTAVLAVAAELWAGRRLSRRGVRAWPIQRRRAANRNAYRASTTRSVSSRGSRQ